MKLILKKINTQGSKIYDELKKSLLKRTNIEPQLGKWIDFYYPVGGGCFYVLGGKIIKLYKKTNNLNQSVKVRTRLSKEVTEVSIPIQVNHFLIIN